MKRTLISVLAVSALVVTLAPSSSYARHPHKDGSWDKKDTRYNKSLRRNKRAHYNRPYRESKPVRYNRPYRESRPYRSYPRRVFRVRHTMDARSFRIYLHSMSDLSFGSSMLAALRSDVTHHSYTARQVRKILSLFSFDSYRLRALALLAPRIVDPANSVIIYDRFSYNHSRRKARSILAGVQNHAHAYNHL